MSAWTHEEAMKDEWPDHGWRPWSEWMLEDEINDHLEAEAEAAREEGP